MKIAVIKDENVVLTDAPDLSFDGKKGAIVKVLGCGLCGSDIVKLVHKISPEGTVLGHEIVAQIIEINSSTDFKKGDKIITSHHIPCKECDYCLNGNVSMCKHFKETNILPGGFSEYVFVSEEHLQNVAYLLPKNLTEVEASFYEPLGCCIRAVKRANLRKGTTALIVGLGSIGILMAQAVKAFGINAVGCDLIPERIVFLKKLGIDAYDVRELPEDFKAQGIFMTSGADKAISTALKHVKNGGTILVFSSTPSDMSAYPNNEIYYRELTVLGSYSPSPADLQDSVELLKSGSVIVKGLSTIYEFEKINEAFSDTMSNKIMKAYVSIGHSK